MRKPIHILTILMTALTLSVQANNTSIYSIPGDSLSTSKAQPDSIYSSKKICSCRLMRVKTDEFDSQLVAIFAEKTPEGKKMRNNYKILDEYIRREKIYFRIVFLKSLVLKESFKGTNGCSSLFKELKLKIANLRMYNIINVDELTELTRR